MEAAEAYKILLRVIEQGFYAASVTSCQNTFLIKTLTPKEELLIRYHSAGGDLRSFRIHRLAYATAMINGEEVLHNRPGVITPLVKLYSELPRILLETLEEASLKLQRRYLRACKLAHGFSLGSQARYLWRVRKNLAAVSMTMDVFPDLGMSHAAEVWSTVNANLDLEEENDRELGRALLVASSMNPKGVKQLSSSIDTDKKTKKAEKEELIKYGNMDERDIALGIIHKEKEHWTAPLVTAKDMVRELERQMSGEKDKHDLFIDSYREKLAAERAATEEAARVKREELRELAGISGDPVSGSFGVTEEEMKGMMDGSLDSRKIIQDKADNKNSTKVIGKRVLGARRG